MGSVNDRESLLSNTKKNTYLINHKSQPTIKVNYYENSRLQKVGKLKQSMKAFQTRPLRKNFSYNFVDSTSARAGGIITG